MSSRIMTISITEYLKKRILLAVFFVGLVLGTFIINTMNESYYNKINVTQDYYINMIETVVVKKADMLRNCVATYYKEFVLILVANCFFFGKIYNTIYLFVKGAGVGILLSSYVMKYGAKGMLIYVMSIFPHYFIYVPSVILTICAGISMRNSILDNNRKDIFLRKIVLYFITILIFSLIIALAETYFNIPIFKKVIKPK